MLVSWGLVRPTAGSGVDGKRPSSGVSVTGQQRLTDGFPRQWSGPPPRIGLFGDFSTGKSSVANLLLGRNLLPTAVLATTRRPTVMRYAPELQIEAIGRDGTREITSPDAMTALSREGISRFEIGLPSALLLHFELLDTAGFADPYQDDGQTQEVVDEVDICIWCTLATQAWRLSEQQTWLGLPPRLQSNSILVATHADNLMRDRDLQRVKTRLQQETGRLFASVVLLAVPDAMRARGAEDLIADPKLWRTSGGESLLAAMQSSISNLADIPQNDAGLKGKTDGRTEEKPAAGGSDQKAADIAAGSVPLSSSSVDELGHLEVRVFLLKVMAAVPSCLTAAWIDLDTHRILHCSGVDAEEMAASPSLGPAISNLFQGDNVQLIEKLFKSARGLDQEQGHYFKEIALIATDCLGIMVRSPSRADRALVVVADKTGNFGLALATVRELLTSSTAATLS